MIHTHGIGTTFRLILNLFFVRLSLLKQKLQEQRRHLDDLDKHMYVLSCPRLKPSSVFFFFFFFFFFPLLFFARN
jgi:hypothetical protein